MLPFKKLKFIFGFLFVALAAVAHPTFCQKVSVRPEEAEIDKMRRKGLATTIELDRKTVEKAWQKRLKELGKTESDKGIYTLKSAMVPALSATPVSIFSHIEADTKGTTIFYAIDLGTEYVAPGKPEYDEAKKILHEFAVQVYRDDLNRQIEEADKAVEASVRLHDKQQEQGLSLMKQIERNQSDKAKLMLQLQQNLTEMVQLKNDSAQNKLQQSSALEEIDRLRKVSVDKKNKLGGIQ